MKSSTHTEEIMLHAGSRRLIVPLLLLAAKQPADTTPAARPAKRPRNPRLRVPH